MTQITVECWGAGGGGQRVDGDSTNGGGGSGGGYVKSNFTVTPGTSYNYSIGAGGSGNSGQNGSETWFSSSNIIKAVGGNGAGVAITANNFSGPGALAPTSGNIGGNVISQYGGNGANGTSSYSGGGGSSAGTTAAGNALGMAGGIAPANGYAGANGISANSDSGNPGNIGAGGSGARKKTNVFVYFGGNGGNGQIRITYTDTYAYCLPSFPSAIEPITNVTFGTINNTSSVSSNENIERFCTATTNVTQGANYTISLKGNTNGNYTNYFTIFVDWNKDGDFNDTNEIYYAGSITNSTGTDAMVAMASLQVPFNAALGQTILRVVKKRVGYADPCNTTGYGQAEDYQINVLQYCPSNVVINNTNTTVCGGKTQTITVNDITTNVLTEGFNVFSSKLNYAEVTGTFNAYTSNYYAEGTKSLLFSTSSTNASGYLQNIQNINLSPFASATLSFKHICATEAGSDFGYVEYSTDGGSNWTTFPTSSYTGSGVLKNGVVSFDKSSYSDWNAQFTSTSSTPGTAPATSLWKSETINIPQAALSAQFKIRLRYTTNPSNNYYG